MADTAYDDMLDEILGIASADEEVAVRALRNACREFFRYSTAWRYDHPAITTTDEEPEYTLTPDGSALITTIIDPATYKDDTAADLARDIHPFDEKDAEAHYQDWKNVTGTPEWYLIREMSSTFKIHLIPAPITGVASALNITVAQMPTKASTGIPDYLAERWFDDLSNGALYKLFEMPEERWSNDKKAGQYRSKFKRGMGTALQIINKSHMRKSKTIYPRQPFEYGV